MICPHCSKPNPDDAQYCQNCGRELPTIAPQAVPATHSLNVVPVQYAGFWRRVLASLIDGILLSIVTGSFTWTVDFDDFKITAVPEPASAGLLSLGALALLRRRRGA